MNYFLYLVTKTNLQEGLRKGEHGVGKTSIRPGIMDAPYGVMYVAPGHFVSDYLKKNDLPAMAMFIEAAIKEYFEE